MTLINTVVNCIGNVCDPFLTITHTLTYYTIHGRISYTHLFYQQLY